MMCILKKFFFILLLNIVNLLYSQTSEIDLHKKYWYYKSRFNNDFVSVGINAGQSIPFNQRAFKDTYSYGYPAPSFTLKTGDASAQLGIYIAVLATEYRLLKNQGQTNALPRIKHELFCALNAVNRIDYFAEPIISANPHPNNPNSLTLSPALNGFFVRDDIDKDFVKNHYLDLNYYNDGITSGVPSNQNADRGFTQLNPGGQLITSSSYQTFYDPTTIANEPDWNSPSVSNKGILEGMEESQDQLYYLLMGTALASKLVDAGETDGANSFCCGAGNSDLKQEAINISDRLIKHVKNSAGNLWRIRNPANGNAFVQVGDDAQVYGYALDNLGCFIKYGQDFPSYAIGMPYPNNACTDYRNLASSSSFLWNHLIQLNGGPAVDMQGFYHALMGTCNCSMESRNFLNTTIQIAIQNAQNALNSAVQGITNQINNLLNQYGSIIPPFIKNAINNFYNTINNLIDIHQSIIAQLTSQLVTPIMINTTEERLIYNNYHHSVLYDVGCTHNSLFHIGSDSYFGIFLKRVLHPNQTTLPSHWQQMVTALTPITYSTARNDLKSILDAAPCEGNYNFYPYRPGPEWGNPNRIDRMDPTYRYNTTCPTGFLGEYHGLDYMLYHNLYYLAEGATSFINYSDRKVTYSLPVGNNFTSTNKNTLGAYEYITASNFINSNAAADYRAGKEISLLPGFSIAQGADFSAKIDPYACGANNLYNGEMLRTNEQNQEYAGEGKPKKSNKRDKPTENSEVTLEQEHLISEFEKQLDSLFKTPDYTFQSLAAKIEIYPNPNEGNFNIAFNLANVDNINLTILDALGRIVFSQKHIVGFYTLPIDLSSLSKGVYLVKFENSNGEISAKKVTIN